MNKAEYIKKRTELLNSAQEAVNGGDFEAYEELKSKIDKLDSDFEAAAKATANLEALRGENSTGGVPFAAPVSGVKLNDTAPAVNKDIYATDEYRHAFMMNVLKGTPIPEKFRNTSETTTSTGASTIVPTQVFQKLVVELENVGEIYAEIFKSSYPAALLIPTQDIKPTASWVDEDAGADTQKVSTDKISFAGYKLECKIAFSLFITKTALADFESQFVDQAKTAIVKAIESSVISGSGTGAPKGIMSETAAQTVEIAKTSSLTYSKLIECEAAVPAAYDEGTVWLMTKKSFFDWYGITDQNGQPVARVSAGLNGKPEKTLLGRRVIFTDGYMSNYADTVTENTTFAMLYRLSDYVFNEVMGLSIKRYEDDSNDNTVIKLVMLADGKSIDSHSLVKVVKKSA